jgi:hypothetical protein
MSKNKQIALVSSKCESLDGIEKLNSLSSLVVRNNRSLLRLLRRSILIFLLRPWIDSCIKIDFDTIPALSMLTNLRIAK